MHTQNNASDQQQGGEAQQQQAASESFAEEQHPFDIGNFSVATDDEGIIDFNPATAFSSAGDKEENEEQQQQQNQQQGAEGGEQEGADGKKINWEEDLKKPEEDNTADLIAQLKAKGIEVNASGETADKSNERNTQIQDISSRLTEAQAFLQKNPDELIKTKLRDDLVDSYKKSNRSHLVGTEEFNLDLESDLEELSSNKFNKQIVLQNITSDVQNYINKLSGDKSQIESEILSEKKESSRKNQEKLQSSFEQYSEKGFNGIPVAKEVLLDSYKSITNGDFQKEIQQDPNLLAEFRLYTKLRSELAEKLGQPKYGEGVKAAFDQINNGDQSSASKSPLSQAMQSKGSGGQRMNENTNGRFKKQSGQADSGERAVGTDGRFGG